MGYSREALSMFKPLANPEACRGTSYFALYPKELPWANACWLPGSLFVRDAAFCFFAGCFHAASESFNYYAFQRFGEIEIVRLVDEFELYLRTIAMEPAREQLFSRYPSVFATDIWSEIETETLASAVRRCGEQLRTFVQLKTRESRCLWVLGM
jgi:hypothetical protein